MPVQHLRPRFTLGDWRSQVAMKNFLISSGERLSQSSSSASLGLLKGLHPFQGVCNSLSAC